MAADQALVNRVRAVLSLRRAAFEEKKMFAGVTFMIGGKMCISVGPNRMMCRIDPRLPDSALERNGCRSVVMKGREYRGYVHVDADVLKDDRDLEYWTGLALDYNERAKASTRKRR